MITNSRHLNPCVPKLRVYFALLAFVMAALPSTHAFADMVSLIPVADTSLTEVTPTNNTGGRPWVNAGTTMKLTRNRGLFKFDIAGNIPAGARITSSSLRLPVTGSPSDGYAVAFFDLHRLLRDWGEGVENSGTGLGLPATPNEADWITPFAFTTNFWSAPGAAAPVDFVPTVTAAQIIYTEVQSPFYFPDPSADASPMIADLQFWLDHPAGNFGWILICESEDVASTARRFGSREDPDFPPILSIGYTPPIGSVDASSNLFSIHFIAQAGQAYAIDYSAGFSPANTWQLLTNIPPPSVTTNITATDAIAGSSRFYRLRTQ